eukprot:6478358-Amphidinium_carterae.1
MCIRDSLKTSASPLKEHSQRSAKFPYGFPSLGPRERSELSPYNKLASYICRRIRWRLANWGFISLLHPRDSWFWNFKELKALLPIQQLYDDPICLECFGGMGGLPFKLVHNSPILHKVLSGRCPHKGQKVLTWDLPPRLLTELVKGISTQLQEYMDAALPSDAGRLDEYLYGGLTKTIQSRADLSTAALDYLNKMLQVAVTEGEQGHLRFMLQHTDCKGSDATLRTGTIHDATRQCVPYPAGIWQWQTVQTYKWQTPQHINVLEYVAFLNYLRWITGKGQVHSRRMLHVFDSRVVSCIAAKGRSSARMLNRIARRSMAYLLASNNYLLTAWTSSQWNFADRPSRLHDA